MKKIKLYPIFVCFWLTLALVVMLAPNAFADWQAQTSAQSTSYKTATMPAPSSVSAQGTCTYGTWGGPGKQCSGSQEFFYSCPSGTLSGTECISSAGVDYVCSYGSYNGSECVGSAEVSYYCPSGRVWENECLSPATLVGYDCTDAGFFGGTTTGDCLVTPVANADECSSPWTYVGPSGGGGSCIAPALEVAPPVYTCSYGSLSGPGCIGPEETSYSCPSGTLSGTECISSAGVDYVCSYGSYNGSECVGSAEVSYYCPSGTTLSGSECVSNPTSYILSWIPPSSTDADGYPLVGSWQIVDAPYRGSTCTPSWTSITSEFGTSTTSHDTVGSPSSSECYSVQAVGRNGIWTSGVPNGVVG